MLGSLQMSSTMPGRRERKPSFSSTSGAATMLAARPPNWRGVEQSGLAGVEDIVLIKSDSTKKRLVSRKNFSTITTLQSSHSKVLLEKGALLWQKTTNAIGVYEAG